MEELSRIPVCRFGTEQTTKCGLFSHRCRGPPGYKLVVGSVKGSKGQTMDEDDDLDGFLLGGNDRYRARSCCLEVFLSEPV